MNALPGIDATLTERPQLNCRAAQLHSACRMLESAICGELPHHRRASAMLAGGVRPGLEL